MNEIKFNFSEKQVIVAFHVGRGGRFYNAGHKTFLPDVTVLPACFRECDILVNTDEVGSPLPDAEWKLVETGSDRVLLEGRSEIESPVGKINRDYDYDTDIAKYIEDCDGEEMDLLYNAYVEGSISDLTHPGAIEYILDYNNLFGIKSINFSHQTAEIIPINNREPLVYMWDAKHDVTEDEIKSWLSDHGVDALSIEEFTDDFVCHFCL